MAGNRYDVAIVGGGTAGLSLASRLARWGFSVVLLEEDDEIGQPEKCSGIISSRNLSSLVPACARETIVSEIKTGELEVRGYGSLELSIEKLGVVVVNRSLFDKCLLQTAAADGLDVRLKEKVYAASLNGGASRLLTRKGEYAPSITVDARGASAYPGREGVLYASQISCYAATPLREDSIKVLVDKQLSKEYFFWTVPLGKNSVKIGGAGRKPSLVNRGVEAITKKLGCTPFRYVEAPIVVGGSKLREAGPVRLGDSAGQTKPTTGGGVALSLLAADLLADEIKSYLEGRLSSIAELKAEYHRGWRRLYGREEAVQTVLRRVYERMDNKSVWSLAKNLYEHGLEEKLLKADFDRLGGWAVAYLGISVVKELASSLWRSITSGG